jgi:NADH-quinone oxidoreductase subunit L
VFFGNERFRAPAGAAGDAAHAGDQHEIAPESPTVAAFEPPKPARLTHGPHEAPPVMVAPVLTLAFLAAVGGLLSLPFESLEFLAHWLEPTFEGVAVIETSSFVSAFALSTLSGAFGVVGIALAYGAYRRGLSSPEADPLPQRLGPAAGVSEHAFYIDEEVTRAVGGPGRRLVGWLDRGFDQRGVDGALVGLGRLVRDVGELGLRRVQTGLVRNYALGVAAGAALLLLYLATRSG